MTVTTTVVFVYSLPPAHCLSRYDFSPLVTQPTYSDFLSSLFFCHVYKSDIHSSQTHCTVQSGKEEKMPELFGEILGMGEKRSQALQRISKEQRISMKFVSPTCNQMLCRSTHSSYVEPPKLMASLRKGRRMCDSKHNIAVPFFGIKIIFIYCHPYFICFLLHTGACTNQH